MRYTIKEHTKFKLRKPYKRVSGRDKLSMDYYRADERNDGERNLKVNVLIMAKAKKKNNKDSRVTAGELFAKLGRKDEKNAEPEYADEEFIDDGVIENELNFDAIDVSSGNDEDSESELDINELLKKYLPKNEEQESADDAPASGGGILSKLKMSSRIDEEPVPRDENEKFMDALDSVFNIAPNASAKSKETETSFEDLLEDEFASDEESSEEAGEYDLEKEEALTDVFEEAPVRQKKPGLFASLFGKKRKAQAEEESLMNGEMLEEDSEGFDDSMFSDVPAEDAGVAREEFALEEAEDDAEIAAETPAEEELPELELPSEPSTDEELIAAATAYLAREAAVKKARAEEEAAKQRAEEARLKAEEAEKAEKERDELMLAEENVLAEENADAAEEDGALVYAEEGEEITDEKADPTDINLMVAFGLDNGNNEKAKELGDRLEAKQLHKPRKFKLDRPEFVDKTQIPEIRKEFHDKEVSLWIRLVICAVFTGLLLVFENITTLTSLFTGSAKQFAGVFDPAVYPVVYIMISLQLMLLACFCAYGEILNGIRSIFKGAPRPESMTALLVLSGIIYSAVLSHVIKVPSEPVMFNFIVALSAFLTLVAEICNNRRESMNFRIIANKRPKHIVRRLPDEESECESKAFADADDVCDVMKIEKTDFVDGFFARLRTPESGSGIFMTFIMSVCAALAVLFGIFVNLRGGDASTVVRVAYTAMLTVIPLSVYVTFSYPLYRANIAAKEYDSAIIGDSSLEEYSNASIISFDDKNVFPSYSVKVQNMRIYNNARIDRVLYYAASVFAYAGGPLQDVFEVATRDMGCSENVDIFDTESGFLAAQVDGVNIIFGSYDALCSRGLEITDEQSFDDVDFEGEHEIMYMFRENKLVAKMYIQYVMDADIDLILKQFSGSGLYVCVRTFDPNIDERMIARKLNVKRMPLKIVRYRSMDEVSAYTEKADSGLVTCGTPKSLLQVISYCGKVLHTKKTNIALSVLSVMIGVAILLLLVLAGYADKVNSLFIAVYQLLWLIPMVISSKMFIR